MASRKVMFRSLSGDGRSGYHNRDNHTAQNGRTSICSYLNSVRPERRSTLCSVMAQLTEETQPSFETTLRSKAVSETSNVKFSCVVSGYPAPEVTWYKDDMQLDRYCGLPKYEISCEGKNHTLHIYNCTLDDAAIYQASAQNSRGIVSCSGVLEVGIMSEFKIHQNYFAKLKQRAESKRREQEEPRIQNSRPEPPSSVGPERAQRKRRSPMQAVMSLSDTNSTGEMEEQEALNKTSAMEDRLSGLTSERTEPLEVSDKVVTDENKVSAENSIPGRDESNTGLTYIHDTVNMTTSRCTAKQPNTKKKIKISEDKHSTEKQTVRGKETDMEKLGHAAQNVGVLVPKEKAAVQSQSDKPNAQATFSPKTQRVKKTSIATQTESISETKTQACAEPKIKEKTEENDPSSAQSHTLPHLSKAPQQVSSQIPECLSQTSADTHMDVEESSAVQCETAPSALIPMATEDMAGKVDQRLRTTSGTVSPGPGGLVPVKTETTMTSHQSWNGGERDQLSTQSTSARNTSVPSTGSENQKESNLAEQTPSSIEVIADTMETYYLHHHCNPASQEQRESADAHSRGSVEGHTDPATGSYPSGPKSPGQGEKTSLGCVSHAIQQGQVTSAVSTTPEGGVQARVITEDHRPEDLPNTGDFLNVEEKQAKTQAKTQAEDTMQNEIDMNVQENNETATNNSDVPDNIISNMNQSHQIIVTEFAQFKNLLGVSNTNKLLEQTAEEKFLPQHPKPATVSTKEESMGAILTVPSLSVDKNKLETAEMSSPQDTEWKCPERQGTGGDHDQQSSDTCVFPVSDQTAAAVVEDGHSDPEPNGSGSPMILSPESGTLTTEPNVPAIFIISTDILPSEDEHTKNAVNKSRLCKSDSPEPDPVLAPFVSEPLDNGSDRIGDDFEAVDTRLTNMTPTAPEVSPASLGVLPPCSNLSIVSTSDFQLPSKDTDRQTEPLSSLPHGIKSQSDNSIIPPCADLFRENSSPTPNTDDAVKPMRSDLTENTNHALSEPSQSLDLMFKPNTSSQIANHPANDFNLNESKEVTNSFVNQLKRAALDLERESLESSKGTLLNSELCAHNSEDKVKTEGTGTRGTPLSVENGKTQTDSPKTRVSSSYSSPKADTTLKTSATPKEIASGARRKTISSLAIEKEKGGETVVSTSAQRQGRGEKVKEEESPGNHPCRSQEIPHALPRQQLNTPSPLTLSERRSPKTRRRMLTPEPPKPSEESAQGLVRGSDQVMDKMTAKTAETDKQNPFKAPQVIRKIRAEALSDTLGHLKLWCQFFNVLSDSTLKWYRDEVQIAEIKRSAGDESHVNLALVQTSTRDSGVYSCTITNEYGTVTTDYLLSPDILSNTFPREDPQEVGEEIEMTPLLFSKGLADAGSWGNKFFGRVMTEEAQVGVGCEHKTTRVKVIYGLDPVFESGKSCFVKVRNPIAYGSEDTCSLAQKNLDMTKQDCKIQNMAREYCKIFAAEAREIENFGPTLEVMPLHLMYRPASSVPYATIEAELKGVYLRYCGLDRAGELIIRDRSQIELKCSALQHWIHQWTNGNLLFTRLEGVDTKLTNIGISFRSKGYQGLPVEGNPKVFELFQALHQCNYYCGLLSLRPLKTPDTLLTPARPKGSRSPLLHRRITPGSSSPQTQRRPTTSNRNASTKDKTVEVSKSGRR